MKADKKVREQTLMAGKHAVTKQRLAAGLGDETTEQLEIRAQATTEVLRRFLDFPVRPYSNSEQSRLSDKPRET